MTNRHSKHTCPMGIQSMMAHVHLEQAWCPLHIHGTLHPWTFKVCMTYGHSRDSHDPWTFEKLAWPMDIWDSRMTHGHLWLAWPMEIQSIQEPTTFKTWIPHRCSKHEFIMNIQNTDSLNSLWRFKTWIAHGDSTHWSTWGFKTWMPHWNSKHGCPWRLLQNMDSPCRSKTWIYMADHGSSWRFKAWMSMDTWMPNGRSKHAPSGNRQTMYYWQIIIACMTHGYLKHS